MCTKPLIRAETYETYINQQGKTSYKCEWLERDQYDQNFGETFLKTGRYRRINVVPCGQCIECRLQYSREWATRLMLEKNSGYNNGPYPDGTCWFLTLTYSDENLKTHHVVDTETGEHLEGVSLDKQDFQKFMKRLRKQYPEMKIKYFMCGEYGKQTQRPHYHAIVYGLPLETENFIKTGISKAFNDPRWKLERLTDIWGLGLVDIGRVTFESCAYVARYTLKKALGDINSNWDLAQGRIPEYVAMSNGISKSYFKNNISKIFQTDSVPIANKKTGANVKPPKYYMRMLKEIDSGLYDHIKERRLEQGQFQEILLRRQTDLTPEERRKQSEERMKQVVKDLRTEV